MIHLIPIESYEARYTAQWNLWFPRYLDANHIEYRYYLPTDTPSQLDGKAVLDPFVTHLTKFRQLYEIVEATRRGDIRDGDTILIHDLWFPGIEALAYIRTLKCLDVRIVGIIHAGSYDPADFTARTGMTPWAKYAERSWFTLADEVLVATEYHRDLLLGADRGLRPDKVTVTGIPLDLNEVRAGRERIPKVRNRIAFPHRDVPEKDPDLAIRIERRFPSLEIVRTRELTSNKKEYYDLLASCQIAVSNSTQETFGYAMAEASALGCIPLVPNRLAYRELYPDEFRFDTETQLMEMLDRFVHAPIDPTPRLSNLWELCTEAIPRIIARCVR